MTLENDRRRGDRARQVLENELFQESFEIMEQAIFEEWKYTADEKKREALWIMIQMMPRFEAVFVAAVNNGVVASGELKHILN
jgi:hypothetical protein